MFWQLLTIPTLFLMAVSGAFTVASAKTDWWFGVGLGLLGQVVFAFLTLTFGLQWRL